MEKAIVELEAAVAKASADRTESVCNVGGWPSALLFSSCKSHIVVAASGWGVKGWVVAGRLSTREGKARVDGQRTVT